MKDRDQIQLDDLAPFITGTLPQRLTHPGNPGVVDDNFHLHLIFFECLDRLCNRIHGGEIDLLNSHLTRFRELPNPSRRLIDVLIPNDAVGS